MNFGTSGTSGTGERVEKAGRIGTSGTGETSGTGGTGRELWILNFELGTSSKLAPAGGKGTDVVKGAKKGDAVESCECCKKILEELSITDKNKSCGNR